MKFKSMLGLLAAILLSTACGPSPEAIATQTAVAVSATQAARSQAATATQAAVSKAATATYVASTPKTGHWAGDSAVSFEIDPHGNITNFSMEIEMGPAGKCQVSSMDVATAIKADRTFSIVFGDKKVTKDGGNTIQGKFTGSTTVTGSYSKLIFCIGPSGKAAIYSRAKEGAWTAKWVSP